jgi:hypothetical protein
MCCVRKAKHAITYQTRQVFFFYLLSPITHSILHFPGVSKGLNASIKNLKHFAFLCQFYVQSDSNKDGKCKYVKASKFVKSDNAKPGS